MQFEHPVELPKVPFGQGLQETAAPCETNPGLHAVQFMLP